MKGIDFKVIAALERCICCRRWTQNEEKSQQILTCSTCIDDAQEPTYLDLGILDERDLYTEKNFCLVIGRKFDFKVQNEMLPSTCRKKTHETLETEIKKSSKSQKD